jgi:hypothetical protein
LLKEQNADAELIERMIDRCGLLASVGFNGYWETGMAMGLHATLNEHG